MQRQPSGTVVMGVALILVLQCISTRLAREASGPLPDLIIQRAHVHKQGTAVLRNPLFPGTRVTWAEYTLEVVIYNRGEADWEGALYLGMTQTDEDYRQHYYAKYLKIADEDFRLPSRETRRFGIQTTLQDGLRYLRLIVSYRADLPRLEEEREAFTHNNEWTIRLGK